MRKSRKIRYDISPTYAFVVDGETEIWYLQMLKRNERSIRVNIKPEIPNRKTIKEQFDLVVDLSGREYLRVFWIVDLDTVVKESREISKEKKPPISMLIDYRNQLKKKYKNVTLIINNPCLEYWFLLHFKATSKLYKECLKVEGQLRKVLSGYEKTRQYYTGQGNDIYLKLKPHLNSAIRNAQTLGEFSEDEPLKALCEMDLLFTSDELKDIALN